VRADGATVCEGAAWQVIVAVTGAFGGGSAVGAADPQDGVLDVAILPAGSRIGLARRAWGLKRGTIAEQSGVEHHRGAVIEVDLPPGTELRRLELGRLGDGRPFVNVASAGLASVAARRAAPLKPRLGSLAYAVGALRAAATAVPLPCAVQVDGRTVFEGAAWQVIVAVTGAFGGGSAVGAADPADGVLDVAVLPAGSRAGLARRAWGMRRHTIAEQRGVAHHRAMVVEVQLPPGTEFNADGEVRDRGLERVEVERDAYGLVVPA